MIYLCEYSTHREILTLFRHRRFLTPLQQTTFENIVTKEEIAQNEQFLLLPQCFQFCFSKYTLIYRDFYICVHMFPKSSAAYLWYGKGLSSPIVHCNVRSQWFKLLSRYKINAFVWVEVVVANRNQSCTQWMLFSIFIKKRQRNIYLLK